MGARGPKPGSPKTGGRKKGTPNRDKAAALLLAQKLGVDTLEILLHIASANWKALGYKTPTVTKRKDDAEWEEDRISLDQRLHAAKEVTKYCYPQLKAVDLTVDATAEHTHQVGADTAKMILDLLSTAKAERK